MIPRLLAAMFLLPALAWAGGSEAALAQRGRCLSEAETVEAIGANRLVRPSQALSDAAGRASAEPVGAKLCQWDQRFVYEITLLRGDGRVLRVVVDAANGRPVN